jgi:murein DD-endopeptidase MepM/ murein hydrolase activator NlpD
MAQFTDIIKSQRQSGKSVIGSLSSAIGQKSLEKIDPRNYLFNRKGTMAALFPGLKGYQAKSAQDISKFGSSSGGMSSVQVEEMSSKLDSIGGDLKIVAKNSVVLPHLARDMNVVRQNIIKLVKIKGGKPNNRADMFFLRARERESAYEAQIDKATPVIKKEAKQKEKKEEGIFSKIGDFLAKFTLGNVLGWLLQGAAILTIMNFIGKLILEKDFREAVWKKFDEVMRKFGTTGEDVIKNVATALGVVAGVMFAFQVAVNLAIAGIKAAYMKMMTKGGVPAGPTKGNKKTPKTPPKSRFGILGVLGGGLLAAEGVNAMTSPSNNSSNSSPSSVPSFSLGNMFSSNNGSNSTAPVQFDASQADNDLTKLTAYSPNEAEKYNTFGAPRSGGTRAHQGIDLGRTEGAPVVARESGVVKSVKPISGYGHTIELDHGNGKTSFYAHLKNKGMVEPGQQVTIGQQIAEVGATDGPNGERTTKGMVPHLHLEYRVNGKAVDPRGWNQQQASLIRNENLLANNNKKGNQVLALGTNVLPNPSGQTTINNDNRTTNITNADSSNQAKTADPSDQLFKMLFMNVA